MSGQEIAKAALAYAAQGLPVFPCNPATKAPLTRQGFQDASRDADVIARWWKQHPDAMIGMPTGEVSGVWVLDVDDPEAFEAASPVLPTTRKVATGKGYHLYFEADPLVRNAQRHSRGWPFPELPGAEVRGDGGYVIMPPSVHPSGKVYTWANNDVVAPAPLSLLDIVTRKRGNLSDLRLELHTGAMGPPDNCDTPYGLKALQAECEAILRAHNGEQESTLNAAALKTGALVAGGELSSATAMSQLCDAARKMTSHDPDNPWTEATIRSKIARALADGTRSPRSAPPRDPQPVPVHDKGGDKGHLLAATPFVWRDPNSIPMRPWVLGSWLLRGVVTLLIAPGGAGKSTFLTGMAVSLSSGVEFLNQQIHRGKKRVWLWNLEDDIDELVRSVVAAANNHGIDKEVLEQNLFLDSGFGMPLCTAIDGRDGVLILEPVFEAITAELRRRKIDVLMIDPFVSSHKVDENSNAKIDAIAKQWSRVAVEANCSIVLCHHASKAGSASVSAMSARGAGALVNAARSALVVNRMTSDEAERYGIDEIDIARYIRVADDKHNRAPADGVAWFRLASVDLGNGAQVSLKGLNFSIGGDSVGVIESTALSVHVEEMSDDQVRQVQSMIKKGPHNRASPQAAHWAGHNVAEVMGLNATGDRRMIRAILFDLEKRGHLKEIDVPVDNYRMKPGYCVPDGQSEG